MLLSASLAGNVGLCWNHFNGAYSVLWPTGLFSLEEQGDYSQAARRQLLTGRMHKAYNGGAFRVPEQCLMTCSPACRAGQDSSPGVRN